MSNINQRNTTNMSISFELIREREKNGNCGFCGNQTHKLRYFGYQKESLTITNVVHNGRCLLCYPMEENVSFEMFGNAHSNNNGCPNDDPVPMALAIPFEIIEHSDVAFFDAVTTVRTFPEPSAPPKEEENFEKDETNQDIETCELNEDANSNGIEISNDQDWTWYIITEEDTLMNGADSVIGLPKNNSSSPNVVFVSKAVYEKLSSMINYGTKSLRCTLSHANPSDHHLPEINIDSPSMYEIELKEFAAST